MRGLTPSVVRLDEANARQRLRILVVCRYVTVRIDDMVLVCFAKAITAGERTPACMRLYLQRRALTFSGVDEYYKYERAGGTRFAKVDACEAFSGQASVLQGFSSAGSAMPQFL